MKKPSIAELDLKIKNYILDCITSDDHDFKNNQEKIDYAKNRFYSECPDYDFKRYGNQKALANWLAGLPFNHEYRNFYILELAIRWGTLPLDYSELQADKILSNYWNLIAARLDQLFRGDSVRKGLNLTGSIN